MGQIQRFHNDSFGNIRMVVIGGKPWFCGSDVGSILGYTNARKAIKDHVDCVDKTRNESFRVNGTPATLINESGVYALVLASKLPNAKAFKHWITSEVIPSVRQHGVYATDDMLEQMLNDPDSMIKVLQALSDERKKNKELTDTTIYQRQEIATLRPKADYVDMVLQCKDVVPITLIAKDYGLSATKLNRLLHQYGVQYRQGGVWVMYQKYADKGYVQSKTYTYQKADRTQHVTMHTQWTQKGRLFIYDLLKANGIMPVLEREGMNELE